MSHWGIASLVTLVSSGSSVNTPARWLAGEQNLSQSFLLNLSYLPGLNKTCQEENKTEEVAAIIYIAVPMYVGTG